MRRLRWLLAASLAGATGLTAQVARAADDDRDEERGPWSRGTIVSSLGFGGSFGQYIHELQFELGVNYFVWHGLGLGLDVDDTIYIFREEFRRAYPRVKELSATNEVGLMPTLQYVFLRRFRVSPYVRAGLGPVFYNHKRGTVGEWMVGPGVYITIWGPLAFKIGIEFSAQFPLEKWRNAFRYDPDPYVDEITGLTIDPPVKSFRGCAITSSLCSFNISFGGGLVFLFRPDLKTRKRDKERREPPPAPVNPMYEEPPVQAEPEPVEPEPVEPETTDELAPPEDAPPEDAPPEDAPPLPEDAPPLPEDAPPPSEDAPPPDDAAP